MKKQGSLTKKILLALAAGMFSVLPAALAMPTGGVSSTANIPSGTSGTTMEITSSAANNVINWQTFSIASGETVAFDSHNYLNLVTGSEMSRIYGSLTGGGTIALINPNGIIFGAGANVNVGSLIASTQPITDTIGSTFANSGVVETSASAAGNITNVADLSATTVKLIGNNVVISSAASLKTKTGSIIQAAGDVGVGYAASDTAATEVNKTEYTTGYTGTAPTALTGVTVTDLGGTTKPISGYMQVRNVYELQNMKNNLTGKYLLTGDIDASETSGWNINADKTSYAGFSSIGNNTTKFTGNLNGMGYTITGLTINGALDYTGLFGSLGDSSLVSNVTASKGIIVGGSYVGAIVGAANKGSLDNVHNEGTSIKPSGNNVGGIAGTSGGQISNSSNSGEVSSDVCRRYGGIVGVLNAGGSITASYNTGVIKAFGEAGGIAGNSGGTLTYVYNTGTVTTTSPVKWSGRSDGSANENGGIVGYMSAGTIAHAYNTGNLTAAGNCIGGMVGHLQHGTITDTYNTGTIVGHGDNAGGLVGYAASTANLSDSYNTGDVTDDYARGITNGAGGIVGQQGSLTISNVYNTGTITATNGSSDCAYAGGIVGAFGNGSITDAYNMGKIIGKTASGGIVGSGTPNLTRVYNLGEVAAYGGGAGKLGGILGNGSPKTTSTGMLYSTTTADGTPINGSLTNTIGTGKAYSDLLQAKTFTDNGWTTENLSTVGGTSAAWRIYDGYTTPLLKCFLKTATATGTPNSFTYDGTVHRPASVSYSALADNHLVTQTTDLVVNTAHATETKTGEKDAGTYTYRIYSDQQHYDIIDPAYTIAKAKLTITTGDINTPYGTVNTNYQTTTSGLVAGDAASAISYTYTDGTAYNGTRTNDVGSYSITTTATGDVLKNYDITYADGNINIGKADLTITTGDITTTYGTVRKGYTSSHTALVNGDSGDITYTYDDSLAYADDSHTRDAGTYAIKTTASANGGLLANYNLVYSGGSITIAKAPLTITGKDVSVYTGSTENPAQYGYTATGLMTGEEGLLTGITYTTGAGAYTDGMARMPGTYTIDLKVPQLTNYAVNVKPGTLTVLGEPMPVTPPAPTPTEQKVVTDTVGSVVHQHDGIESHDKQGSTALPMMAVLQPVVVEMPKSSSSSAHGNTADDGTLVLQNAVTGTTTTLGTLALGDMRVLYKVYDGGAAVPDTAVAAGGQEVYAVADFDAGVENRRLEK